ncbi:MAG: saccharopine dehydrogenase NADP-binding domain-containing protein [Candidatus Heimdallarchaeota archaeon]|nr:saccharopine dehydrogenase NADP-binding domain-containing protein [Candidatus Heimdallarchaeota archaeon]
MYKILVYGANGFTGKLISRLAKNRNIPITLGGRNEKAITELANELNYPYTIFDLENHDHAVEKVKDFDVVLHAAGPFSKTSEPMIKVCIEAKTHYTDITGEIAVFEKAKTYDEAAKQAGIVVLPGVGFDVVPTDCLALHLKENLLEAKSLELAFYNRKGVDSRGTYRSTVEALKHGAKMRKAGNIVTVPFAKNVKDIDFSLDANENLKRTVITIPWGDVSTAYHTTGIPNIETLKAFKPSTIKWIKLFNYQRFVLKFKPLENYIKNRAKSMPEGPDQGRRGEARSYVWGKVDDLMGTTVEAKLECPEGYTITADAALVIAQKLEGTQLSGYHTPGSAFGVSLLDDLQDVKYDITKKVTSRLTKHMAKF